MKQNPSLQTQESPKSKDTDQSSFKTDSTQLQYQSPNPSEKEGARYLLEATPSATLSQVAGSFFLEKVQLREQLDKSNKELEDAHSIISEIVKAFKGPKPQEQDDQEYINQVVEELINYLKKESTAVGLSEVAGSFFSESLELRERLEKSKKELEDAHSIIFEIIQAFKGPRPQEQDDQEYFNEGVRDLIDYLGDRKSEKAGMAEELQSQIFSLYDSSNTPRPQSGQELAAQSLSALVTHVQALRQENEILKNNQRQFQSEARSRREASPALYSNEQEIENLRKQLQASQEREKILQEKLEQQEQVLEGSMEVAEKLLEINQRLSEESHQVSEQSRLQKTFFDKQQQHEEANEPESLKLVSADIIVRSPAKSLFDLENLEQQKLLEQQKAELEKQQRQAEEYLKELKENLKSKTEEIENQSAVIIENNESIAQLQELVKSLVNSMAEVEASISEQNALNEGVLAKKASQLEEANEKLKELKFQNVQLQESLKLAEKEKEDLERALLDKELSLGALRETKEGVEQELLSLKDNFRQSQKLNVELEANFLQKDQEFSAILSAKDNELSQVKAELESLKKQLKEDQGKRDAQAQEVRAKELQKSRDSKDNTQKLLSEYQKLAAKLNTSVKEFTDSKSQERLFSAIEKTIEIAEVGVPSSDIEAKQANAALTKSTTKDSSIQSQ